MTCKEIEDLFRKTIIPKSLIAIGIVYAMFCAYCFIEVWLIGDKPTYEYVFFVFLSSVVFPCVVFTPLVIGFMGWVMGEFSICKENRKRR